MTKLKWHMPPLFTCMKFAFCPDEETWEVERERVRKSATLDIREYPTSNGMCVSWHENEVLRVLVTIHAENDSEPIDLVSVIAHECYHLACHVLEAAAEQDAGEETIAYLVGDLVKTIWEDYVMTRHAGKYNMAK